MTKRFSTIVAAGTLVGLSVLAGCGGSPAPQGGSAAPVASPATSTSAAAATPTPSATPADETADVQAAARNFMKVAFALGGSVKTSSDWADRVEPLMTKQGYDKLRGVATVDKTLGTLKTRFGGDVRTTSDLVGKAKISKLTADHATADIKFQSRVQQRDGDTWKTLKKSPEETGTLLLVKDGDKWLVDDAG